MKYAFLIVTMLTQLVHAKLYNCKASNGVGGTLFVSDSIRRYSYGDPETCTTGYYGEQNCGPSYSYSGKSRDALLQLKNGNSVFTFRTTVQLSDGSYEGYSYWSDSKGVSIKGDVDDGEYKVDVRSKSPWDSFSAYCYL